MKLRATVSDKKYTKLTLCDLPLLPFIVLLLISSSFFTPLYAQEHNEAVLPITKNIPYNDVKTGSLYLKSAEGYISALRQNSDYHVEVNGLLARVSFSQTFINTSELFLEAIYLFPLMDDAAVDHMVMAIGGRRIVGKIKEKQLAKKMYQHAKQQGKKASLVSQHRPKMFTTKLSNIAPGETIKITISYLQSVVYRNEEFTLRIPLTITPRYMPHSKVKKQHLSENEGSDNHPEIKTLIVINNNGWADISTPQTRNSEGQKVKIDITLNTGLALINVVSRYHQIIKQKQSNITRISLANKNVLLDRDFVLTWQVEQGNAPKAALFQMTDESFHYGLLMIMPPINQQGETISKDVVYIIDNSGSMGGVAIKQAKQALHTALDMLNEGDSFNIIAFNDDTQTLFKYNLDVTQKNIAIAKRWLQKLTAGGGTNMHPAIEQAFRMTKSGDLIEAKLKQVIFITDGSVANEQALFTLIEGNLGSTRLQTVGIGSAPNSYFMSRAAESGRGTYRYIGSINEVNVQMYQLFTDINQPMMRNITLDWPVDKVEYYPLLLPDLYQSQPMVISARWAKTPQVKPKSIIKIAGQLAKSTWQENIYLANKDTDHKSNQGIDQWWARQKIKHLTQQHRRSDEKMKIPLKQQITQLALKHHLVSPYTSFIAVEEKASNNISAKLTLKRVANLMPKGSTQIIPLANTALGVMGYLYLGLALLVFSLLLKFSPFNNKPLDKNQA